LEQFAESGRQSALVALNEGRAAEIGVAAAPPDEHDAAEQREVGGGVSGVGAGLVFEPGGIAGVMVLVFHPPVRTDRAQRVISRERFGDDEYAATCGGSAGGFFETVALDLDQLGGVNEADLFRGDGQRANVTLVDPAVAWFQIGGEKRGAC
jgi:hypothetical protein